MATDLEKFLREMGLAEQPPVKVTPPVERQYRGIWYRDGDIPH